MKRISLFWLALVCFLLMSFSLSAQFAGGSGTESDPWQIASAVNLYNVRDYLGTTHSNKHFIQIANIDLGVTPWNEGTGWVPIGYDISSFSGHYNGNGFAILNLYINRPQTAYQGLFASIGGNAVIQNLGVVDVNVIGAANTGGLVGQCSNAVISNCYSSGILHGYGSFIGGLVGFHSVSSTYNSYSTCTVFGSGNQHGGLVGRNHGGTIQNCYSMGDISGDDYIGGFVGSSTSTISNCFSRGNVNGNDYIGGFVGENFALGNCCFSTGVVSGTGSHVGGFVGTNSSGIYYFCYWDAESSGLGSSDGGYGRTTDAMTWPYATDTFQNWDFNSIWNGDPPLLVNAGYPYLRFQIIEIPYQAINPNPVNLSIGVQIDTSLSWELDYNQTSQNAPTGFFICLGTDNPPSNIFDSVDCAGTFSYQPQVLLNTNTVYFWQVIPYNFLGSAVNCPVWSFTTELSPNPHALISINGPLVYDFGQIYLGDTSSLFTLTLHSVGSDTLLVNDIYWQSGDHGFNFSLSDLSTPIPPGSSLPINIWFQPQVSGIFSDSLIVETNALNIPLVKVKVTGRGENVPPLPPDGLEVSISGYDVHISWNAVTQTIYNTPIVPDGYLVFYNGSSNPEGEFYFHGFTTSLSYTHYYVGRYAQNMFYRVRAVKNYDNRSIDIASLVEGMLEAEVIRLINR